MIKMKDNVNATLCLRERIVKKKNATQLEKEIKKLENVDVWEVILVMINISWGMCGSAVFVLRTQPL